MKRLPITLAATTALVALGATAALASGPPYTIKVGSATSGTFATALASTGQVTATAGSVTLTCNGLTASGSVAAGNAQTTITTFSSMGDSGCVLTGFGPAYVKQAGTAAVKGTGTTASTGTTDVVASSVTNLSLSVAVKSNPALCRFTLVGSAAATFREGPQEVAVSQPTGGSLTATNVSGCAGQVPAGSSASLSTTLGLTVPSPSGALVRLS